MPRSARIEIEKRFQQEDNRRLLTKDDIAARAQVHRNSVNRMVREGRFPQPQIRDGTLVRWTEAQWASWVGGE